MMRLYGHRKTMIVVLGYRGMRCAKAVDGGVVSGHVFWEFVNGVLLKMLKRSDIVVMDNLASHKTVGVRERIESVGCERGVSAAVLAGPESD
jgi:hypothetical protein